MQNDLEIRLGVVGGDDIRKLNDQILKTEMGVKKLAKAYTKGQLNSVAIAKGVNQLRDELVNMGVGAKQAESSILKLYNAEIKTIKSTQNLAKAQKQLTLEQMAATKESNRLGIVTQQAGYQVSDFIVQIQSGTNGFVAFGQQASQLVGVLPLVASRIGLTAGAAIGLSASLGIIIPIITMVGAALTRTGSEAKTFSDAIGEAESALSDYEDALDNVLNKDLDQEFGSTAELIRNIEEATLDLSLALGKIEISNAFAKLTEDVDASLTATQKFLRGMAKTGANILDVATFGLGGYTTSAGEMFTGQEALNKLGIGDIVKEEDIVNLQKLFKTGQFTAALIDIEDIFNDIKASNKTLGVDAISFLLNLKDTAQVASDLQGKLNGSAEKAKKKAEFEKDILNTGKMIDGLLKDANKEIEKTLDLEEEKLQLFNEAYNKQDTINKLLATEQKYGKDSTDYKILQASLEDEKLKKEIDSLKISETQKGILKQLVDEQRRLLNELDKEEEKRKRILKLTEEAASAYSKSRVVGIKADVFDPRGEAGITAVEAMRAGVQVFDYGKGKDTKNTKGKTPAESMASIIKGMEEQANLQRQIVGLSDQEADRLQILYNLKEQNKTASGKMTEAELRRSAERIAAINAETAAMEKSLETTQGLAETIVNSFGDAFLSIIEGTESAKDAFRLMAQDILKDLYRILVVEQMVESLKQSFGGSGGTAGNFVGDLVSSLASNEGGGYTGSGPRSGGLDGKGGFLAMLHPKETVIDHHKGQSGGQPVQVVYNFQGGVTEADLGRALPVLVERTKREVVDAVQRGGNVARVFR